MGNASQLCYASGNAGANKSTSAGLTGPFQRLSVRRPASWTVCETTQPADLLSRPPGRPSGQQRPLRSDPGVLFGERPLTAALAGAFPAAFPPAQPGRPPERGKIDQLYQPLAFVGRGEGCAPVAAM